MEELKSSKADSHGSTGNSIPAYSVSPIRAPKAGPRLKDRQNYAQDYASGYQLSFYGAQEVTDALVIRPTLAAER
jgi:hypothetical protein